MQFVHNTGFTLGSIDQPRVTPVLRDRSGAGRALQAQAVEEGGLTSAVSAAAAPQGSNQAGPSRGGAGSEDAWAQQEPVETSNNAKGGRGPAPWQSVATPDTIPEPNPDADPESPLRGEHVTLTGEFEPFDKGQLWAAIAEMGGQVGKNVTKKTTILVAGAWNTVTSKEKRARELQEKGQDIQIWDAAKLLHVLGLDEQPPF